MACAPAIQSSRWKTCFGGICTDPGYNLWVTGPVNGAKPGIQPLSGLIETDWNPFTFTMNWRLTHADEVVNFTLGAPICQFFLLARALPESVEMVSASLADDPELEARYRLVDRPHRLQPRAEQAGIRRAAREVAAQLHFRGHNPDGSLDHQTELDLCPFPGGP